MREDLGACAEPINGAASPDSRAVSHSLRLPVDSKEKLVRHADLNDDLGSKADMVSSGGTSMPRMFSLVVFV